MERKSQPWHETARLLAENDPPLSYAQIAKLCGPGVTGSMVSGYYTAYGITKPPAPQAKPNDAQRGWLQARTK